MLPHTNRCRRCWLSLLRSRRSRTFSPRLSRECTRGCAGVVVRARMRAVCVCRTCAHMHVCESHTHENLTQSSLVTFSDPVSQHVTGCTTPRISTKQLRHYSTLSGMEFLVQCHPMFSALSHSHTFCALTVCSAATLECRRLSSICLVNSRSW